MTFFIGNFICPVHMGGDGDLFCGFKSPHGFISTLKIPSVISFSLLLLSLGPLLEFPFIFFERLAYIVLLCKLYIE